MMKKRGLALRGGFVSVLAGMALYAAWTPALAAEKTWTGASSADWGTAGNWTGGVPAIGDIAAFDSTSNTNLSITGFSPASTGIGLWLKSTVPGDVSLTPSGNPYLSGAVNVGGNTGYAMKVDNRSLTFNCVTLFVWLSTNQTWYANTGSTVTLNGNDTKGLVLGSKTLTFAGGGNFALNAEYNLNETGGLVMDGTGTLTLSKMYYSGGTAIQNGRVVVATAGTLGAASGTLTMGTGTPTTYGTVGHLTLSNSVTVGAMTVQQNTATTNGADVAQLSIASGKTLTASSFTVGVASAGDFITRTALGTGSTPGAGGTLTVNGNFAVGVAATSDGAAAYKPTVAVADLSGLSAVNVTSANGSLRVGYGWSDYGALTLANSSNTLKVGTLSVGDSAGANYLGSINSTLKLGNGTNTIQAPTIVIGQGKGAGIVRFAGASGSVTITGTNGTGKANITLGNRTGGSYQGINPSALYLAGHDATVAAGTVYIGQLSSWGGGSSIAEMTFDTGTVTVDSIQMAAVSGTYNASVTATLTVGTSPASTGVLTLNGDLSLANNSSSTNQSAIGSFIINGGTANLLGNIISSNTSARGTVTTTLTLNGGTLDMNGRTIGRAGNLIGTLNFQSGTLKNVGEINNGAGLTKTGTGTLTLSGQNTYTGLTTVANGTLKLTASNVLSTNTCIAFTGGKLDLNFTGTQTVSRLYINGAWMTGGTYGSTSSPAQKKNDTYFSGTGVLLQVNPAPPKGTMVRFE